MLSHQKKMAGVSMESAHVPAPSPRVDVDSGRPTYAVAFDVELDKLVPPASAGESRALWTDDGAPHITCAATYSDTDGTRYYHSTEPDGSIAARLGVEDAGRLLDELYGHMSRGALIVTWGGTAVDFRALHGALQGDADRQSRCVELARQHIDIPIASATDFGGMIGLDAAARGMGQGRKSHQLSLAAPSLWSEGRRREVLQHVGRDSELTLRVYIATMTRAPPSLHWQARSGRWRTWWCATVADAAHGGMRLRNVAECLAVPLPRVPFQVPPGMDRDVAVAWMQSA